MWYARRPQEHRHVDTLILHGLSEPGSVGWPRRPLKLAVWRQDIVAVPGRSPSSHDPAPARAATEYSSNEAAQDLLLGLALGGTPGQVVAGGLVPAQPHDHDPVQRRVGLAVTAAIEPVADGLAGGGLPPGSCHTTRRTRPLSAAAWGCRQRRSPARRRCRGRRPAARAACGGGSGELVQLAGQHADVGIQLLAAPRQPSKWRRPAVCTSGMALLGGNVSPLPSGSAQSSHCAAIQTSCCAPCQVMRPASTGHSESPPNWSTTTMPVGTPPTLGM